MLDLRRGVPHLDIGDGVRAAVVAQQQRITLGEVADVFGGGADAHQAAIGVVRLTRRYALGDDGGPAVSPEVDHLGAGRSEEHTSELQSLMRISYAFFCLKKIKIQII